MPGVGSQPHSHSSSIDEVDAAGAGTAITVTSSVLDRTHSMIRRGHLAASNIAERSLAEQIPHGHIACYGPPVMRTVMVSGILAAAVVMARAHTARA